MLLKKHDSKLQTQTHVYQREGFGKFQFLWLWNQHDKPDKKHF